MHELQLQSSSALMNHKNMTRIHHSALLEPRRHQSCEQCCPCASETEADTTTLWGRRALSQRQRQTTGLQKARRCESAIEITALETLETVFAREELGIASPPAVVAKAIREAQLEYRDPQICIFQLHSILNMFCLDLIHTCIL